jgi:inhibitor of cysteine peptidase
MKIKLALAISICLLSLSLLSCAQVNRQVSLRLTYDDFTQNKIQTHTLSNVRIGNTIAITLPSNATTGFQWSVARISDSAVLSQEGNSEYVLPESTLAGAGGQEIWTFKALKRGSSTIYMEYSQAWQGGTKNAWTFTASVTVK